MSLQVQSSQQPTSGRRTPQIYQNLGSTGSATSASPPTNGSSGGAKSSSKLSLKPSAGGKQSPVAEVAAVHEPTTAPKDSPKKTNLLVAVTKLDTSGTAPSPKADKEKDEKDKGVTNGSSNGSGHSEKELNGKHEEPVKPETPKQETVEKVEKEKKVKDSPRASPRSTPQKQQQSDSIAVEQVKTPESAGKKSTPVVTPEQKKRADHSLAAEKPLKGFTAEGDEMESLVVEPTEYEDSPMPPRTGGKTKLLKYSGAPPTRARISPFRVHEAAATNASTIVNLSTVSEGGQSSDTGSKDTSPSLDFNRPLRAISGRRGTRPISDIQFTYRKSPELNDSSSSLNVTIGSEIHNDSLRTPAPGSSRKRKAMTPESTSDALDVKEVIDSPKRTRLDFSGFLGMVSSPVTMLKNRLSRVRLQSSTPVAKRNFDDEDPSKCVQAEATTTTANISGEGANMDVDTAVDAAAAATTDEAKKAEEVEGQKENTEGKTDLPSEEGAAQDDGSGDGSEPPVEVKDVTNKQRPFCVVM